MGRSGLAEATRKSSLSSQQKGAFKLTWLVPKAAVLYLSADEQVVEQRCASLTRSASRQVRVCERVEGISRHLGLGLQTPTPRHACRESLACECAWHRRAAACLRSAHTSPFEHPTDLGLEASEQAAGNILPSSNG
eukprot:6207205-Pleurochrysis_carterae.AAC.1